MPVRMIMVVVAALAAAMVPAGPASSQGDESPSVTGIEWLPRGGTSAAPILQVGVSFEAPAGLESGELRLASRWHDFLAGAALGPYEPGSHSVQLQVAPSGDETRSWEVVGLTLNGADGRTTTYGLCDLAAMMETRESPGSTRLSFDCLDGAGWIVYTLRAEVASPQALIWQRGVMVRDNSFAGWGHVMQDASGSTRTWGIGVGTVYTQSRDQIRVSVAGQTIVNEGSPDPSTKPGSLRASIGVAGWSAANLTPGEVYRWGAYFATRPGHSDLPLISLEGSGFTVLGVEAGSSASIAWGDDFDPSVELRTSGADVAVVAHGEAGRSFERSATCMFNFWGNFTADFIRPIGLGRIEGPSGPVLGGGVIAGEPGPYRFEAIGGVGGSSSQPVVACADMPMEPQ